MELEPEPGDEIPCKDCRAYWYQYKAFMTYAPNCFQSPDVLPSPGAVPRKTMIKDGKPVPGGRCATHWRAERNRKRVANHARRVQNVYTLSIEDYESLKEFQGGVCAICQRATGQTKRLAVDHDHTCCAGKTSCGRCVRGLLCSPCNSLLAHIRDSSPTARRIVAYLNSPPAKRRSNGGVWP